MKLTAMLVKTSISFLLETNVILLQIKLCLTRLQRHLLMRLEYHSWRPAPRMRLMLSRLSWPWLQISRTGWQVSQPLTAQDHQQFKFVDNLSTKRAPAALPKFTTSLHIGL
ncbi:hypothetical protein IEQ34_013953 [Dendrobium chrysotoxum]|uniref:Secreted protein n=1 Tax=Dendrobium chrysotoxum TaxID=161865 RepID=A0AAV7GHK7_DENCH|nr:hypothetical protein IEQ34_013953 [Dendrobium chrysotoxum]